MLSTLLSTLIPMRAASRYWMLVVTSFALTAAVVWNAFLQKQQFYPSMVYLSKSTISLAVIHIQAFVLVLLLGKILCKLFFGTLRETEVEHLIEKGWYVLTETCLAFTVFRDDFSSRFVAMFTLLLLAKCFHWLLEDRIDLMERSLNISFKFHVRVICLLIVLTVFDLAFIRMAYSITVAKGASAQLVFGFEYSILLVSLWMIGMKYMLHVVDLNSANSLENKTAYFLYMELVANGLKVLIYSLFLFIMVAIHTFPLFAIRPMYLALKAFRKACFDVVMSRRAITYLNTMFRDADATTEELSDTLCAVCREEMTTSLKRLPCNHVFHTHCLRSWFQRQQTCPTCRIDILRHENTLNLINNNNNNIININNPNRNRLGALFNRGANNPPGGQPVPAPSAATTSAGQANPAASSTNISSQFSISGTTPMFMIPPPAFMTPLPNLENILEGMSDEELRQMEGNQRRNVQARIQCLSQIQVLLDAAVTQMNQYSAIVATLPQTNIEPNVSKSTPSSSTSKAGKSSSSNVKSEDDAECPVSIKKSVFSKEKKESGFDSSVKKESELLVDDSDDEFQDPLTKDELRRRRVDKLKLGSSSLSDGAGDSSRNGSGSLRLMQDQDVD